MTDQPCAPSTTVDLEAIRERWTSGYEVAEEPFETHAVLFDLVDEVESLRTELARLTAANERLEQRAEAAAVKIKHLEALIEFALACEGNEYSLGDEWIAEAESALSGDQAVQPQPEKQ
jgi:hypothetical protein